MLKVRSTTDAWGRPAALVVIIATLAAVAAVPMIACGPRAEAPGSPETPPQPEVLSLTPSGFPMPGVHELILAWKPMSEIDRFVLCETIPPHGTDCEEHRGASEATVTAAGPTDDPQAAGLWLKYLWLQSCWERECSRPPTAAGAIAHQVGDGTAASNFIAAVRRLESYQVEVTLVNASQEASMTSTLIARSPTGPEIARCESVAPGEWCGPFRGALLSNDIVAEQIYGDVVVTTSFAVLPSTTAPEPNP